VLLFEAGRCRHGPALNSGQVPIAVVAAWAGHADGGATALKHYIRVRPGDLEAARDAIAALLGA
jgi:hypothetical protein